MMFIGAKLSDHYAWNGGRTSNGEYTRVMSKGHFRADRDGYVLEHILIAEKALRRPLPEGAEVHHVNEIKEDNRHHNLVICQDRLYHRLLHRRMNALKSCGRADARWCYLCKTWECDDTVKMETRLTRVNYRHRMCRIEYERNRRMTHALLTVKPLGR